MSPVVVPVSVHLSYQLNASRCWPRFLGSSRRPLLPTRGSGYSPAVMSDPVIRQASPDGNRARSLLAPEAPAAYEVFNGSGRAPLLLLCDHATRFLPRAFGSLGLSEAELQRHIAAPRAPSRKPWEAVSMGQYQRPLGLAVVLQSSGVDAAVRQG